MGPSSTQCSCDELLDDQGDGAALQAGDAGEVGARDRVAFADQVEDDAAVDIAHHFTRSALDARFVEYGHSLT